jgi:hypothetical protein
MPSPASSNSPPQLQVPDGAVSESAPGSLGGGISVRGVEASMTIKDKIAQWPLRLATI